MIKAYINDPRNLTDNVVNNFERVQDIDDADILFTFNDNIGYCATEVKYAKLKGIPTVWLDNNRVGSRVYSPDVGKKFICDYAFLWGQRSYDELIGIVPEWKLYITGCPLIEKLPKKEDIGFFNIVYAPNHWIPDIEEVYEVLEVLNERNEVITVKSIQMNDNKRIMDYGNYVISTTTGTKMHLQKTLETIASADIVVVLQEEQTFAFLCHAMHVPVVRVKHWEPKKIKLCGVEQPTLYTSEILEKNLSGATYDCTIETLNDTIDMVKKELRDPLKLYSKFPESVNDLVNVGGYGKYNFSERFMANVKEILNGK